MEQKGSHSQDSIKHEWVRRRGKYVCVYAGMCVHVWARTGPVGAFGGKQRTVPNRREENVAMLTYTETSLSKIFAGKNKPMKGHECG